MYSRRKAVWVVGGIGGLCCLNLGWNIPTPAFNVIASSFWSQFLLKGTFLMCEYVYRYVCIILRAYAVVCIVEVYKYMDIHRYAYVLKYCVCMYVPAHVSHNTYIYLHINTHRYMCLHMYAYIHKHRKQNF